MYICTLTNLIQSAKNVVREELTVRVVQEVNYEVCEAMESLSSSSLTVVRIGSIMGRVDLLLLSLGACRDVGR